MNVVDNLLGTLKDETLAIADATELLGVIRGVLLVEAAELSYSNGSLRITCNTVRSARSIWAVIVGGGEMPWMTQMPDGLHHTVTHKALAVDMVVPKFDNSKKPV